MADKYKEKLLPCTRGTQSNVANENIKPFTTIVTYCTDKLLNIQMLIKYIACM